MVPCMYELYQLSVDLFGRSPEVRVLSVYLPPFRMSKPCIMSSFFSHLHTLILEDLPFIGSPGLTELFLDTLDTLGVAHMTPQHDGSN